MVAALVRKLLAWRRGPEPCRHAVGPRGPRAPTLFDWRSPADFLRRLKRLDRRLDCVDFGDGHRLVCLYDPKPDRMAGGRDQLRWLRSVPYNPSPGSLQPSMQLQGRLAADGWAGLLQIAPGIVPGESHLFQVVRMLHASPRDVDHALREAAWESKGRQARLEKAALRSDFIQHEARPIHRFFTRHAKTFS
jgi:hypothetical protein